MPGGFNGLGTFVLPYNWEQDAANGIDITASRMDGQDQAIADGLSITLTRDGQSSPTAAISWGNQNLTNVATLGATTAAITGTITSAILATTGNATIGGTLTVTGALSAAGGLSVTGNASVTGTLSGATVQFGDSNFFGTVGGGNPVLNVGTNSYIGYVRSAGTYNFVIAGTAYANLSSTGLGVTGAVTASGQGSFGTLNVSGNAAIGGSLSVTGGVTSFNDVVVTNNAGRATLLATGDLALFRSGGTTSAVYFNSSKSSYLYFDGSKFNLTNLLSVTGGISATDTISTPTASVSTINIGADWAIVESSGRLTFLYQGVAKFSFDGTGSSRQTGQDFWNQSSV